MKKTFFSKVILTIFIFWGCSASSQIRVKPNVTKSKANVVKKNRSNKYNDRGQVKVNRNDNRRGVRAATNRNRVVVTKPNRPRNIVKRPNYNRPGYVWIEGYWQWNSFYNRYTWRHARWQKIKQNHYWVPGFWEITPNGFFWVAGYWALLEY